MIYSAIFNSNTIIADYSEEGGDFQITLAKILKVNRQPLEFYTINYSSSVCFFLHKDDYTFSTIVNQNVDNEKVLIFLQALKEQFFSICKSERDNLTLKTTNLIKDLMFSYGDNLSSQDKFEKIDNALDSLKTDKLKIVEQMFEKEVLLANIVNKSDNLKQQSVTMRRSFEAKKKKNTTLSSISLTAIIIIFIILLIIAYFIIYRENYFTFNTTSPVVDKQKEKFMSSSYKNINTKKNN